MLNLRSILTVGLALNMILTACAPARQVSLPIPTAMQSALPPATPIPTLEPVDAGVPAIEYVGGLSKLLIISSVTGKPLDGFPSIALESYDSYAYSPDGKTLAVVSSAQLYLIDLPSWKYTTTDIGLHGPISPVIYSPDATLLAFAGGFPSGDLVIVDAQSGEVKTSVQVGFSIRDIKFTVDGKAVMVYGPQLASEGIAANAGVSAGAPKAALYAISDLSLLWSVDLTGIRDGVFPKKANTANTQDVYQPGAAWRYEPGIAFAPNDDILYLVHGDQDKLTTVDFSDRKVKTVDVHAKTTWLDRLLALSAGVAYAKGMDGTVKQAVISPDGKFLFVAGNTEEVTQQANGSDWDITDTPTGLQVIAAEDGTLVDRISTGVSSVRLSPDGKQVYLTTWNNETSWTDVYDISSRSVIKHLDGVYLTPTRTLNGEVILASNRWVSTYVNYITLIDPDTWSTVGEWKSTGDVGWLDAP